MPAVTGDHAPASAVGEVTLHRYVPPFFLDRNGSSPRSFRIGEPGMRHTQLFSDHRQPLLSISSHESSPALCECSSPDPVLALALMARALVSGPNRYGNYHPVGHPGGSWEAFACTAQRTPKASAALQPVLVAPGRSHRGCTTELHPHGTPEPRHDAQTPLGPDGRTPF